MSGLVSAGLALSALSVFLLLWLLRDWWRRLRRGAPWGPAMDPVALRWSWPGLLVAAFVAGLWGLPLAERTEWTADAAGDAEGPVAEETVSQLRLPFYIEDATVLHGFDGTRLSGGKRRAVLQLPWAFLLLTGLYGLAAHRGAEAGGRDRAAAGSADGAEG